MTHWVILKRDNESDYINLDAANRIIHRTKDDGNDSIVIHLTGETITVLKAEKPGTYAHICAYLGIPE